MHPSLASLSGLLLMCEPGTHARFIVDLGDGFLRFVRVIAHLKE